MRMHHLPVHTYIVHTHTRTHTSTLMNGHTHAHTDSHGHTMICIHTHTHTRTHTHSISTSSLVLTSSIADLNNYDFPTTPVASVSEESICSFSLRYMQPLHPVLASSSSHNYCSELHPNAVPNYQSCLVNTVNFQTCHLYFKILSSY